MTKDLKKVLDELKANDQNHERGEIVQCWFHDGNGGHSVTWFARLKDKNLPLNGTYEEWYENGQMRVRENYIDGKLDGAFERWHPNGKLKERVLFKNGEKEGLREGWHKNGQLWYRENYKNGKLEGVSEEWYDTGELFGRSFYCDGLMHGTSTYWSRDGKILEMNNYKNGEKDGSQVSNIGLGFVTVSTYKDGCFQDLRSYHSIDEAMASLAQKKKITLKPKKKGGVKL